MSKMDGLRAMREARYQEAASRSPKPATRPAPATRSPKPAAPAVAEQTGDPSLELCGHRAISGRTCTREAGHSAKSHRYS
jgi:hypothetical protein